MYVSQEVGDLLQVAPFQNIFSWFLNNSFFPFVVNNNFYFYSGAIDRS